MAGNLCQSDRLLTPEELAEYLNVGSRRWVYDNVHMLPAIRINGRLLRFRRAEIDRWLEDQRQGWSYPPS